MLAACMHTCTHMQPPAAAVPPPLLRINGQHAHAAPTSAHAAGAACMHMHVLRTRTRAACALVQLQLQSTLLRTAGQLPAIVGNTCDAVRERTGGHSTVAAAMQQPLPPLQQSSFPKGRQVWLLGLLQAARCAHTFQGRAAVRTAAQQAAQAGASRLWLTR